MSVGKMLRYPLTYLAEFRELFAIEVILGPLALGAAVDVDGDAVLVGPHHPLDLVLLEGSHEVVIAVGTVLKEPGSYKPKGSVLFKLESLQRS